MSSNYFLLFLEINTTLEKGRNCHGKKKIVLQTWNSGLSYLKLVLVIAYPLHVLVTYKWSSLPKFQSISKLQAKYLEVNEPSVPDKQSSLG